MSIFVALFVFAAVVTFVLFRFSQDISRQIAITGNSQPITVFNAPQPTPFPFQELTIPYLRQRQYYSQLAELNRISSNTNYTEYLTSYDSDGLNINGLLTIPQGEEPEGGWPAIVFIHGYIPPTLYRTTERYVSYVDNLARNGFVVFKIDLRGHGDSEGEASGAYYSGDYIIDTLNAYAALQSAEFVNADKIGLWGHSMAGNVVLRSVAAKQTIPAVVIWAGAVYTYDDLQDLRISDNSYRPPAQESQRTAKREELLNTYGSYDSGSSFWQQVVPTNYLSGVKTAIEIHHAVDDAVVSVEYTRNLKQILDTTSIPHQVYEYQSGGHDIEGASFSPAMQRTVEFYKKYL